MNVKDVRIQGTMPFDVIHSFSDETVKLFAMFSSPTWGLTIAYFNQTYVPNEHGGQTAMYEFAISGSEAVSYGSLHRLCVQILECGGTLTEAEVLDMENRHLGWESLVDNEPSSNLWE